MYPYFNILILLQLKFQLIKAEVKCPCFDRSGLSSTLNSQNDIELHEDSSCSKTGGNPNTDLRIRWDDRNKPDNGGFPIPILYEVEYDTYYSYYSCRNGDAISSEISKKEADVCFNLLQETCTKIEAQEQVECPCFDPSRLSWAENTENGLSVDIRRDDSCGSKNGDPNTDLEIVWEHFDELDLFPKNPTPINYYNFPNVVGATYNPKRASYECRGDDIKRLISKEEAKVCFNMVKETCEKIEENICPCFDLEDLLSNAKKIEEGEYILDQDKTCRQGLAPAAYGIVLQDRCLSGAPFCPIISIGVMNDYPACFSESAIVSKTSESGAKHCKRMLDTVCGGLTLSRLEDSQCIDDMDFKMNGSSYKDCKWLSSHPPSQIYGICRKKDRRTGKRIFETCRKTCGYCNQCEDQDNYFFNGREGSNIKGCDWVGQDLSRCVIEGVSESCAGTCETKCCKDDTGFRFKHNGKKKACGYIATLNPKQRQDLCSPLKVAS
eukprot:CAMPEP_0194113194 /NCGR_PEP_ID=MMETSP0150-20130528/15612_1 /TAXON_ID=122233 /ORGANISM="Chaetoceros debilis, Strain MM31A-1" /LENGTH=493 /DNA_ID=CAMNT_0038803059 /DNA_START=45 /DNA_END=1522 /DNA_ORIENTATION=-